jgi:hypothetical protein
MDPAIQMLKIEMENLSKKLHIHKLADWYGISKPLVQWAGYRRLLKQYPFIITFISYIIDKGTYSSIENLVMLAYPKHEWNHSEFKQGQKHMSPQKFLARMITTLFPPPTLIQFNARNTTHGFRGHSGRLLEIDVFLPDLKLGFEYQVCTANLFHFNF